MNILVVVLLLCIIIVLILVVRELILIRHNIRFLNLKNENIINIINIMRDDIEQAVIDLEEIRIRTMIIHEQVNKLRNA